MMVRMYYSTVVPASFKYLSLELYPWYRIFIVSTAPKFERQKFKCFEFI